MGVLIYAGCPEACGRLRTAIEEGLPEGQAEGFSSLESFVRRLREPRTEEMSAVLLAEDQEDLSASRPSRPCFWSCGSSFRTGGKTPWPGGLP